MPRRNRVDPFGNIVAHAAYGLLMGNRGCLHDDRGRLVRTSARDAWITCLPRWPGVHRTLMAPGRYTELFFLDEATAMAAGHRPCGSCRPEALAAFKRAWQRAHDLPRLPLAPEMDAALRASETGAANGLDDVPDGAMVVLDDDPVLRWQGRWHRWSFDGYRPAHITAQMTIVPLNAPAMIAILQAGYQPLVHDTGAI